MSSSSCCAARAALVASASPATSPRVARPAALRSCRRDARRSRARLGVVARASAEDAPASSDGGDDSAGAQGSSYGAAMQNVNVAGVSLFLGMAFGPSKQLAIPHCEVPDIRWVDWAALKAAGFKACVFDKDNTLTVPYEKRVHEPIAASLRRVRRRLRRGKRRRAQQLRRPDPVRPHGRRRGRARGGARRRIHPP